VLLVLVMFLALILVVFLVLVQVLLLVLIRVLVLVPGLALLLVLVLALVLGFWLSEAVGLHPAQGHSAACSLHRGAPVFPSQGTQAGPGGPRGGGRKKQSVGFVPEVLRLQSGSVSAVWESSTGG